MLTALLDYWRRFWSTSPDYLPLTRERRQLHISYEAHDDTHR